MVALCVSSAAASHTYAQQTYGYRPPAIQMDLNVLNEIDEPPPILTEPDTNRYKVPGFDHLRLDPVERLVLQPPPGMSKATQLSKPAPDNNNAAPLLPLAGVDMNPSLPASIAVPPTPDKKPDELAEIEPPAVKHHISAATSLEDIARHLDIVEAPRPLGSKTDEPIIGDVKEGALPEQQQAINIDLPLQDKEKPQTDLMANDPLANIPEKTQPQRKADRATKRKSDLKRYEEIARDPLLARLSNPNAEEILDSIDPKGSKTRMASAANKQKSNNAPIHRTSKAVSAPRDNMIRVLFAPQQTEIEYIDLQSFLLVAEQKLNAYPGARIEIQAYANAPNDSQSSAHRLSLARALSIRDSLVAGDINARLIDLRPMGMDDTQKGSDRADIYFISSGD